MSQWGISGHERTEMQRDSSRVRNLSSSPPPPIFNLHIVPCRSKAGNHEDTTGRLIGFWSKLQIITHDEPPQTFSLNTHTQTHDISQRSVHMFCWQATLFGLIDCLLHTLDRLVLLKPCFFGSWTTYTKTLFLLTAQRMPFKIENVWPGSNSLKGLSMGLKALCAASLRILSTSS